MMISRIVAVLSMVTFLGAQMPVAGAQSAPQAPPPQTAAPVEHSAAGAPPSAATQALTVPAGTAIPVTLINPIRSRTSKPGDAVRATVAFPVTVGSAVAIPAGSYVEGALEQVTPRAKGTGQPAVKIHFTRLVYANGYSVELDAENSEARLDAPAAPSPASSAESASMDETAPEEASDPAVSRQMSWQANGQQSASVQPHLVRTAYTLRGEQEPTPSPLSPLQPPPTPQVGPPMGVVVGISLGVTAAILTGALVSAHHRITHTDYVLFDSGWQFQIVLEAPLDINAAQAFAAVSASAAPAQN